MTVTSRIATEESMVRLITWTRQKSEYQLEPCKYLLSSCTEFADFQTSKDQWKRKSCTEVEVERRKLEVETREPIQDIGSNWNTTDVIEYS